MSETPARAPANRRNQTGFVVKEQHDDGSVTWQNPDTLEEIRMHDSTAPTPALLRAMAANGIVPKRPTLDDYESNGDDPLPEEDDAPETALSRLVTSLSDAGPDARADVKIWRVREGGKDIYCGMMTPDEFEQGGGLEYIRANWGGGRFRIRVYGPSLTQGSNYGKYCMLTNSIYEIEQSLVPAKGGDGVGSNLAPILPVLDRILQRVEAVEQRGGSGNFMEELEKFAKIQALLGGNKKDKSIAEQIADIEALRDLKRGIDEDNGGGSSEAKTMWGALSDVARSIAPVLTAQKAAPTATTPATGIVPPLHIPETFQQPAGLPAEGEQDMNLGQNFMINMMVGVLLKAAQNGDDIETHAPGLADKLPDEVLDLLELPLWFEMLCEALPDRVNDLRTHQAWLTKLRDRIIVLTQADETP